MLQRDQEAVASEPRKAGRGTRKYRLTLLFAVVAMVVIALAAFLVNHVIGSLAQDNLIRIAEENTARDGLHIQSMMRTGHSMPGMSSAGALTDSSGMQDMQQPMSKDMPSAGAMTDNGNAMEDMQQPMPLDLETLAGPHGLTTTIPMLTEGFNIVKFELYDLDGMTLWSSDPGNIGTTIRENPSYEKAAAG